MRAADIIWALAATLPLSASGSMVGAALERAGVSAKVRERVWSLGFWLGPAAGALALAADALPQPATVEITLVLRSTPLGALSRTAQALAAAPHIQLPRAPELLLGVAALGAALRLIQLGRAWLSLRRIRRAAVAAPAETVRAVRAAGVRPSVPVKLSAAACTPVAAGLFRPEILLPERFTAPEAAALVCRHEAQHIDRRDNLRLVLEQLACALLWFDPLRGVLHRRLLEAREERCDAAALAGCTSAERALYARTLVAELTRPPAPALAMGLIGMGHGHAVSRISAIVDPRPARRRPMLTIGLCAALGCIGGGVGYATIQAPPPSPAWVGKVVSAVAAIRPVRPRLAEPGAAGPVARAREEGRAAAARWTPIRTADAAALIPSEASSGPVDGSDLVDDMMMYVNGDMDSGDLRQLVQRFAVSHGIRATPENMALLQQAALRSVPDGPRIDVAADYVEQFDGATRLSGEVEMTGDLRRAFAGADVRVDGQPAPPDLVLSSKLVADAVELKRGGLTDGSQKFLSVHIHGLRVAR